MKNFAVLNLFIENFKYIGMLINPCTVENGLNQTKKIIYTESNSSYKKLTHTSGMELYFRLFE